MQKETVKMFEGLFIPSVLVLASPFAITVMILELTGLVEDVI